MNSKNRIIIAIGIVIVVAGGAIWYMVANSHKTAAPAATNNSTNQQAAATITYDGMSFSLSNDKVASGSAVKVINSSSGDALSFDSDPHPSHTDNPELNQGDIEPGQSKTFTLTAKGTWGFHNHENPDQHGTITVE
jgi:plastocyanin